MYVFIVMTLPTSSDRFFNTQASGSSSHVQHPDSYKLTLHVTSCVSWVQNVTTLFAYELVHCNAIIFLF